MGEVHLQLAVLQQRKLRELRAVIAGDGLEHLILLLREVRHDRLQGFVDCLGGMVLSLDPNTHPRHALHQGQNAGLALVLLTDDRVDLPMAKLSAKVHDLGAFFNAPTKVLLVLTGFFRFRVSTKFLRQVDVLDGQQTQIHVAVEGFGANHFLTAELTAFKGLALTGVERPFVITLEMLDDVLKKPYRSQATVLLAAVSAFSQIHLLALVGLVTVLFAIVERHGSTLDLVLDRIVRPPQMLGYAVGRPAVFQSNFNFVSFFAQKVLTFSMFCGIIGTVHSDDPFGIVVSATSILPQNRYYGYSFFEN